MRFRRKKRGGTRPENFVDRSFESLAAAWYSPEIVAAKENPVRWPWTKKAQQECQEMLEPPIPKLGPMERGEEARRLLESPALREALKLTRDIFVKRMAEAETPEDAWMHRKGLEAVQHFKALLVAMLRDGELAASQIETERGALRRPLQELPEVTYKAEALRAREAAAWQWQKDEGDREPPRATDDA